jgi:pyrophosphatase PpaX
MTPVNIPAATASRLTSLEALLFDLDGTVVDTIPHILASFRAATGEVFGAPLSDDVLLDNVGIPLARQMRMFAEDEETAERLVAAYRRFNHATHDEMARLYPNTLSTLEALAAAGLPMAIVTSKSRAMTDRAFGLFGLDRFFDVSVTADDTPLHKPDPTPVLHAASLLGVDPTRCAYVGDHPADIAAGKGAGAVAVGATWGVASRERLLAAGPDLMIDDIAEVRDLVVAVPPSDPQ